MNAMQVRNVDRDMEREDLAFAPFGQLVAAQEAFEDEAALRWAVAIPNDVLIWPDAPDADV